MAGVPQCTPATEPSATCWDAATRSVRGGATGQPAGEQPATGQPAGEQPATGQPAGELARTGAHAATAWLAATVLAAGGTAAVLVSRPRHRGRHAR